MGLQSNRLALGISQSRLARLSGVSRFKICTYELGDGSLSLEQQGRIWEALQAEAERLRRISIQMDFGQALAPPPEGASCG
jgi:predicted transcriptional regulator